MDINQIRNTIESIKQTEVQYPKNIFDILGISRKETLHSRLLSFLLIDSLDTDKIFWNNLIRKIFPQETIFESLINAESSTIYINTEHSFDNNHNARESKNFIDIFISNQKCVIAIENKIEASEGKDQIIRYQKYLATRKETGKAILYLTRNGDSPINYLSSETKLICISWRDIINCIDTSLDKKEPQSLFSQVKNHLYHSFMKKQEDFEKCYGLFTTDYNSYKILSDNFERCIKRQTKEWFTQLQKSIIEKFNNLFILTFIENDSTGKGKFTLTIQKENWIKHNVSIKVYRHVALGIFPCFEAVQGDNNFSFLDNHPFYQFINQTPFNLGENKVYYFSKLYFQDNPLENQRKRWINKNPISLSITDCEKTIERLSEYLNEIETNLKQQHV